jgi:dTDP-4-amino-4,6-dideoxygalactose transaminase
MSGRYEEVLIRGLRRLRARFPVIGELFLRYFGRQLGRYPRPLGNELQAVAAVLRGGRWNMTAGHAHLRLEEDFAAYLGVLHAVAVNTGGMALQMSMRALGMKPGQEVVLQVDTCSATAFAVMNAGCTPIFSDISADTFMLPHTLGSLASGNSRGLIATHMWGNPEDMAAVSRLGEAHGLAVIEDACLALGARCQGRMAGTSGRVGVFSFGCIKPIQGGEGGMIVTRDEALARELRSLRHWGDRSADFGVRDTTQLAWNGRMSEIVAAVVREQLRGYPTYLRNLRDAVEEFQQFLRGFDGVELVLGNTASVQDCAFTQVVVRLDEAKLKQTKAELRHRLQEQGIDTWHANFESIPSLSFFRGGAWRDWVRGDLSRAQDNYRATFPIHQQVYDHAGLGIAKMHFASPWRLRQLKARLGLVLSTRGGGSAAPSVR